MPKVLNGGKQTVESGYAKIDPFICVWVSKGPELTQRLGGCNEELIATFLLGGVQSEVAQRCAELALPLLVEEMQVQHSLLPCLSPCKITRYAEFLQLLRYVPEKEGQFHMSNLKVDGCELQHQQSLWLHDPVKARALGLQAARNLPARPSIGAPLRTGPLPRPGAACAPGVRGGGSGGAGARVGRVPGWPKSCRRKLKEMEKDGEGWWLWQGLFECG